MNNKKTINTIIYLALLLITINTVFSVDDKIEIYSPNYFNQQNKIYEDIHYLENEYLSFKFCTDEKSENIEFNLICSTEKTSLEVKKYESSKGCYYSNYNLNQLICKDFSLEIDYKLDNKERKIKRTFTEQKQSKLINYVLSEDYKTLNPTDLSYYLLVQSDLETIDSKKSQEIYELLKNARNNENKCWNGQTCNLISSSLILKNILMTGYNLNSRLLEDGKNYLERKILNNEKNPIKIQILLEDDYAFLNNTEVKCEMKIDDENLKTYTFDNETLNLTKQISEKLEFSCNQSIENIELTVYTLQGNVSKIIDNENTNSITYTPDKFSCLGENNKCDFTNSLYSLITYGSQIQDSSLIENYLNSYMIENENEIYLNTGNTKYEDMGKYLYYKSNENMLEYLKFKQNNDGSWGQNSAYEKIIQTSWAVIGIQKVQSTSEYVEDGKKWIYYSEPVNGWGSIEKNALAYMAIKEQIKPYIKINAENSIKENTQFIIENPTIYELKNIKIKFSENLNKYLSYSENLGDLNGQEQLTYNISLDKNFFGKNTGEMTITGIDGKNRELVLIKMPITIESKMPFSINEKPYVISEDFKIIKLEIINNDIEFNANCSLKNPFNEEIKNIEITHLTTEINLENNDLKVGEFESFIKCNILNSEFEIPIKINVMLSEKNFEITENILNITENTDFKISITNTNLDKQTLSFEITGDYVGLIEPTENSKIFAKEETREVYFTIVNPILLEALGNNSKGEILILSENGYAKKIPISINLNPNSADEGFKINWIYVTISIILGFVILILVLRYKRQKENEEHTNSSNSHEEEYI